MNNRLLTVLGLVVLLLICTLSFAGGLFVGGTLPGLREVMPPSLAGIPTPTYSAPTPSLEQDAATPNELETLFEPFWQAWTLVHEQFLDQPVDDAALMQGAIRGLMDSLGDPNTSYMDPITYQHANDELAGQYEGIGAYVDTSTEHLTIIAPMQGSPAEQAGLLAGDVVIAVDGADVTGLNAELVRLQVIGPAGSKVRLTVEREGEAEPLDFELTRDVIKVKSASGRMLDSGIAYVEVTTFGDNTRPELEAALQSVLEEKPAGIVLDLRNNGGGYVRSAVEVTSEFLDEGVVLYEQYGDGSRKTYRVRPGGRATDIPIIVLINEGSASAAEIVAGALQDSGRAQLVGSTSYGKGTVQNWIPLSSDQGAVRITIATWLTPDGRMIEDVGLTPDVPVEMSNADRLAGRDPQLDEAVEVLLAQLRA